MAANNWYSRIQKMDKAIVADSLEETGPNEKLKLQSPSLNWALGGGLAFGKVATIYGPESAGKSLIALLAVAALHKEDPEAWAVWYDSEFNFDKTYAARLGIDTKRLIVVTSNQPADIFDHFVDELWPMMQEGFPLRLNVMDSIKAMRGPKEAKAKSVEDHIMGDISQVLPKAFKKIIEPIRKHKVLTICIQQVLMQMDPFKAKFNGPWTIPSGMALKHFSDYMILVDKINKKDEKIWDDTKLSVQGKPIQIGHRIRAKTEKNRTAAPYRVAEFSIEYGVGVVDVGREIAELGMNLGIVERPSSQTWEFGKYKERGAPNFVDRVRQTPELQRAIMEKIYAENPVPIEEVEAANE